MSTLVDVVADHAHAARLERPPLLVLRPLEGLLDSLGIGRGEVRARRIGGGNSNVTYLLDRGGARCVLRRPPRPPLPPSTHDIVREARMVSALGRAGARVPEVLAICEDSSVIGAPFALMAEVNGVTLDGAAPDWLSARLERRRAGFELVDVLAEIHGVDWQTAGLASFGRPDGYLARQVRRFAELWEVNATRDLPDVEMLGRWLEANRPEPGGATIVHGDYRLGNVMLAGGAPARIVAVLDWELATLGDPLADVGYLWATWSTAGAPATPLDLTPITREAGFPTRDELVARYVERTGLSPDALPWYACLALWKASVYCEAIYARYLRGERRDVWAASLSGGVPALVRAADAARSHGHSDRPSDRVR